MYPARENPRLQLYENIQCILGSNSESLNSPRSVGRCSVLNIHVQMCENSRNPRKNMRCVQKS